MQKVHTYRLDAFSSGEAGPLGFVEEGQVRLLKNWPVHDTHGAPELQNFSTTEKWPRVEIIMNYAGANGAVVDALRMPSDAGPLQGLVVAGTGNGTLHQDLLQALLPHVHIHAVNEIVPDMEQIFIQAVQQFNATHE